MLTLCEHPGGQFRTDHLGIQRDCSEIETDGVDIKIYNRLVSLITAATYWKDGWFRLGKIFAFSFLVIIVRY